MKDPGTSRTHPAADADRVLSRATVRAARFLGVAQADLALDGKRAEAGDPFGLACVPPVDPAACGEERQGGGEARAHRVRPDRDLPAEGARAVEPRVLRVRRQQYFLLFAKMHVPRRVPEADKFLRLTLDRRRAFFLWRFGRAPHVQRLNQREVVVLAKWVQTRMAFHCSAVFRKTDGG